VYLLFLRLLGLWGAFSLQYSPGRYHGITWHLRTGIEEKGIPENFRAIRIATSSRQQKEAHEKRRAKKRKFHGSPFFFKRDGCGTQKNPDLGYNDQQGNGKHYDMFLLL
jgi:hypothetical protein